MNKYNNEIFGTLCLLAAGFFLSFGGLLIRLVDEASTMQITSYRSITFSLVALIYILFKYKSQTPKAFINIGRNGLILMLVLGFSNIFFVFGMSNTTVANAVFIMSTGPLFAAFASYFFLKKIIGTKTIIAKQANDFQKLLNNTNNVKIIYMEWPIFGDISDTAAKIALIVWQRYPNLYFEVHNQFMQLGPKMKKVSLIDILNKNELNGEEIFQEAISQKSNDIIEANMKLAKSLGLRGTPASIVNDSIYPGYLQYKTLETLIK